MKAENKMREHSYKSHIFAAVMIFVMGNTVITLPFCKQENFLLVFLLSAVFCIAFILLTIPILKYAFIYKQSVFKKIVLFVTVTAVVTAAAYGAVSAFLDYISFVRDIQLSQTSGILITAAMLVLIVAFVICSGSAILKFCLLMAVITLAVVLLLFAVSIKMFDISYLNFSLNFSGVEFSASVKCFLKYFSVTVVPIAFALQTQQRTSVSNIISSASAGLLAVVLCLLQSVFVLGGAVYQYSYPYIYAVSAFSSGSLFTRLDGLVYFMFFAVTAVKVGICVKTIVLIIKFITKNNKIGIC